jgi:hypothetical protein
MQQLAAETLPDGFTYEWTTLAFQQMRAGNTAVFAFVLAIFASHRIPQQEAINHMMESSPREQISLTFSAACILRRMTGSAPLDLIGHASHRFEPARRLDPAVVRAILKSELPTAITALERMP